MKKFLKKMLAGILTVSMAATMIPAAAAAAADGADVSAAVSPNAGYSGRFYFYNQLTPEEKRVYDTILNSHYGTQGPDGGRIRLDLNATLENVQATVASDFFGSSISQGMVKLSDGKYHKRCFVEYNGEEDGKADSETAAAIKKERNRAFWPAYLALLQDHPELSWLVNIRFYANPYYVVWTGEGAIAQEVGGTQLFYPDQQAIVDSWPSAGQQVDDATVEITGMDFGIETKTAGEYLTGSDGNYPTGDMSTIREVIDEVKNVLEADERIYNIDAPGLSTYEQVERIHDFLLDWVSYLPLDTPGVGQRYYQTALSALAGRRTVCAGYAAAFKVLCDEYGIPCVKVDGKYKEVVVDENKGIDHAWNYVQMDDGKWYAVDCTLDDQNRSLANADDHMYFLVGSDTAKYKDPLQQGNLFSQSHIANGVLLDWACPDFEVRYPELSETEYVPSASVAVTSLAVQDSSIELRMGERAPIYAAISPADATNKTVSWTSSDPAVATVQDGMVTGISAGTAVLTATSQDGGFADTCRVTVNPVPALTYPVQGVFLNVREIGMLCGLLEGEDGRTRKLTATVTPTYASNQAVTWTSENPEVASVDENGVVTANAAGTTVIAVTTADGSFTDQCLVTVEYGGVAVRISYVDIPQQYLFMEEEEQAILRAIAYPKETACQDMIWTSSDESIATVDADGRVTALKAGFVVIEAVSAVSPVYTDACVINIFPKEPVKKEDVATNINLNMESLFLTPYQGAQLIATVEPYTSNEKLHWKTSNPEVATVTDDGYVVPKSAGTATIKVDTGSGAYALCTVTVSEVADQDVFEKGESAGFMPSDRVTLYTEHGFGGTSISLEPGKYNINQLGKLGNDTLSSLEIPEGYRVLLYADGNFNGKKLVLEPGSYFNLKDFSFDDITSSIRVEWT